MMAVPVLVDLVLVVLAIEVIALACWRRTRPAMTALLPNLGAGLALLLALRIGAGGGSVPAVAGLLAAAGICHLVDLVVRFGSPTRRR